MYWNIYLKLTKSTDTTSYKSVLGANLQNVSFIKIFVFLLASGKILGKRNILLVHIQTYPTE